MSEPTRARRPGTVRRLAWLVFAGALNGCHESTDTPGPSPPPADAALPAPTPPVGESLSGLQFYEGWVDPRALPAPVSTEGWEDSSFVAPEGTTLYFGFSPLNHLAFTEGRVEIDGPDRAGQHGPAFDIYEARIEAGAWQVVNSSVNAPDPELHEAAIGVDRGPRSIVFVRFVPGGDIYLSRRQGGAWGPPERLPEPVNSPCIEDNPHLSADGRSLYFDSNRSDPQGAACRELTGPEGRDIWLSELVDGVWSVPARLRGAPNSTSLHWQVFVDDEAELVYWSGFDTDCAPGRSCLYRARRQADGSYGERTVVARATNPDAASVGDVIAIGEMSVTADDRFLYFTYMALRGPGDVDLSLGVARRP